MVELSKTVKKALEKDYFKALHKKMIVEAKAQLLANEVEGIERQMDGYVEMLGYKPVAAQLPVVEAKDE